MYKYAIFKSVRKANNITVYNVQCTVNNGGIACGDGFGLPPANLYLSFQIRPQSVQYCGFAEQNEFPLGKFKQCWIVLPPSAEVLNTITLHCTLYTVNCHRGFYEV